MIPQYIKTILDENKWIQFQKVIKKNFLLANSGTTKRNIKIPKHEYIPMLIRWVRWKWNLKKIWITLSSVLHDVKIYCHLRQVLLWIISTSNIINFIYLLGRTGRLWAIDRILIGICTSAVVIMWDLHNHMTLSLIRVLIAFFRRYMYDLNFALHWDLFMRCN